MTSPRNLINAGVFTALYFIALFGTGFVDPIRTRAEALAAEYGSPESGVYASLEELFSDRAIDAVYLCTPHNLHPNQAIAALDHSCHVFMEKPPAIDLDEFERLRNRAAQSDRRVAVCFQNRYNDGLLRSEERRVGKECRSRWSPYH